MNDVLCVLAKVSFVRTTLWGKWYYVDFV